MKLLLDENLSRKLVARLEDEYPESTHVEWVGLQGRTDTEIWEYAASQNLLIVSKDNDFRQRVFLQGPPPKVVWLAVGNCGTTRIETLLRSSVSRVRAFSESSDEGLLILPLED